MVILLTLYKSQTLTLPIISSTEFFRVEFIIYINLVQFITTLYIDRVYITTNYTRDNHKIYK